MNENDNKNQYIEGQKPKKWHHKYKRYLLQVHHSWIFWVFLVLTLSAVLYYIMTMDFAYAPQVNSKQGSENNRMP